MSEVKSYDDPNAMFSDEVKVLSRKELKKPLLKWCQLNIKAGTRLYRNIGAAVTCTKGTINIPKGIKIAEKSEAKVADDSTMGVLVQNGKEYKRVGGVSPAEELLRALGAGQDEVVDRNASISDRIRADFWVGLEVDLSG